MADYWPERSVDDQEVLGLISVTYKTFWENQRF